MPLLVNGAQTTLQADITSGATTITVPSGKGAMFPTGDFTVTLDDGTHQEIVYVPSGGRSSDTFSNCVRAYESYGGATTAYAFAAATPTTLAQTVTAGQMSRQFAGGNMTNYSTFLSADFTLTNANTWYDVLSLQLTPGTWLLFSGLHVYQTSFPAQFSSRFTDHTNTAVSTQVSEAQNNQVGTSFLEAVVSVTTTTTWYFQVNCSIASGVIKAALVNNATGNNSCYFQAVQLLSGGSSSAYAPSEQVAVVVDSKTAATDGGTFTSGSWQTRVLNTVTANTGNWLSLANNQVTLPAGTYRCRIRCPAHQVDAHHARLQNITTGATLIWGSTGWSAATASYSQNDSVIEDRFTLTATSVLEVQHRCQTTRAGYGLGACGAVNLGTAEIYTVAVFWLEQQGLAPSGSKLLLNWVATTDLANNLGFSANTWTDVPGTTQSFTVDDPNALLKCEVRGNIRVFTSTVNDSSARLVVDSTNNYMLSYTLNAVAGNASNVLQGIGPVTVGPLAAGTHTVKLQVYSPASGAQMSCRPTTNPNTESLAITVWQHPQATTTLSPAVANGIKVLLDTPLTLINASLTSVTTWVNASSTYSFTVDDPNAVTEITVRGLIFSSSNSQQTNCQLLVDSTGYFLAAVGNQSALWGNILAGSAPVSIQGLSVGVHTVVIQAEAPNGAIQTGTAAQLTVRQIPRVQATPVGGSAGDKMLLDYAATTNIASAATLTSATWNNVGSAQTFVVDDPTATVEISVTGSASIQSSLGTNVLSALLVDGATRKVFGGCYAAGSYGPNPISGSPVSLAGLSTGSHTVQLQIRPETQNCTYYLDASGNAQALGIRVWQRPTVYRGGSVPTARLSRITAQSVPQFGAILSFTTVDYDTDSITNLGTQPTRLTCHTPGKYLVSGTFQIGSNTNGERILSILVNGGGGGQTYRLQQQRANNNDMMNGTILLPLAAGDYVEMQAYHDQATSLSVPPQSIACMLSMARVGDVALVNAASLDWSLVPTSDPHLANVVWNNNGYVLVSSGLTDRAQGITPTSNVGFVTISAITDGNQFTEGDATTASMPQQVTVDLGTARTIQRSRLLYADAGHTCNTGAIEWSTDNSTWNTWSSWSGSALQDRIVTAAGQSARYWRLNASSVVSAGSYGCNICMFTLEGP